LRIVSPFRADIGLLAVVSARLPELLEPFSGEHPDKQKKQARAGKTGKTTRHFMGQS
jgi:hypothetical protein